MAFVAGAMMITGATMAIGGSIMGSRSAKKARQAQEIANRQAREAHQDNLNWDKEQYDTQMNEVSELEDMFGPIRENLAAYHQAQSAEQYQLQGKERLEAQYQRSNDAIDALFSNNGMYSSGQALTAKLAVEGQREQAMGVNKTNSEAMYNQDQMQWLGYGTNLETNAKNLAHKNAAQVSNTMSRAAPMFMQQGQAMAGLHMQQSQQWGQFANGGMQMMGMGAGMAFGGKSNLGGAPRYDGGGGQYGPTRAPGM